MRVVLFVSSRIRGYGLRLPVFSKISINRRAVGNQQKWDTFVKERSGGCGSVAGLPALPVVALSPL